MPLFRSYVRADAADADSQASQAAVTVRTAHLMSTIKINGQNPIYGLLGKKQIGQEYLNTQGSHTAAELSVLRYREGLRVQV